MIYLICSIILFILYSIFIEPRRYRIRKRVISSSGIKEDVKVLHLSDLHVKKGTFPGLMKLFKKINKMNPDLILITGDFSENSNEIKYVRDLLKIFNTPTFAVLGNHDIRTYHVLHLLNTSLFTPKSRDAGKLYPALKKNNVNLLKNCNKKLIIKKNKLNIIGITYTDEVPEYNFKKLSDKDFNILLVHSPDYLHHLKKEEYRKIDLILAGHTHGGQVRVPFFGHILTRTKYSHRIADGFKIYNKTYININRGLGQTVNMRFNCRPEAVLIDIKKA